MNLFSSSPHVPAQAVSTAFGRSCGGWGWRSWLGCVFLCAFWLSANAAETGKLKEMRPLLETYCFKCHGDQKPKGGVNLAKFTTEAAIHRDPKTWQSVLRQMEEREMPPAGKPQPGEADRDRLLQWLQDLQDHPDPNAFPPDPGRVLIHRLNRPEYNNTVRDLFGITNNPADRFPADGGGGGGFDNNADTLFIPPILLEKYLEAAEEILSAVPSGRLFKVRPGFLRGEQAAARRNLEEWLSRIFRRPVESHELERYFGLYSKARETGADWEGGQRAAIKASLVSPNFLFRIEADRPLNAPYRISEFELASRLSYFLWSTMPDERLFDLARRGRLSNPAVIQAEVERMLKDPKIRAFSDSFVSQWLGVRSLKTTTRPDPGLFPVYTDALRDAMYEEPVLFFESVLRDNQSLLKLIDADYTFLNEDLARHYGIEGVQGREMQRVALKDANRGGLLGMGSILTITSYPTRTSPVLRGRWILEDILGTPPPPPPPLVPGLPPDDQPKDGLSFRKRLELHRKKPECAACHKRLDPLGFGLENFDAVGRWRTKIGGVPVDASAEMTTGEKFTGPREMKQVLLNRKSDFLRNISERTLAYALGRGLDYYDVPAVKKISAALAGNDYRAATLISEIVQSYPFQYRRNQPVELSESKP